MAKRSQPHWEKKRRLIKDKTSQWTTKLKTLKRNLWTVVTKHWRVLSEDWWWEHRVVGDVVETLNDEVTLVNVPLENIIVFLFAKKVIGTYTHLEHDHLITAAARDTTSDQVRHLVEGVVNSPLKINCVIF